MFVEGYRCPRLLASPHFWDHGFRGSERDGLSFVLGILVDLTASVERSEALLGVLLCTNDVSGVCFGQAGSGGRI